MDNYEDNIRPPDEVIRETLIEDNRNDFEKQIDEAIELSMKYINEQQIYNMNYEEEILQEYAKETKRRKDLFTDFLTTLKKLTRYDKEVKNIYEIIDPIIDSYCSQLIQSCNLDSETHNKIFDTLKNLRIDQSVLNTLKTIILSD